MAATLKCISETAIIPKACRERFLPLQHPALSTLSEMGITGCGLSVLRRPYRIARVRCRFHVAIFTLGGCGEFDTQSAKGRFSAGGLWIAGCGQTYSYFTQSSWTAVWFHLADRSRWTALGARGIQQSPSSAGTRMWSLVDGMLSEAARNESGAARSLRAYAELVSVLLDRELAAASGDAGLAAHAARARQLNALWERIDGELQRKWTIAEMAAQLQLSPVHFHRLVLAHSGAAPMQIVARMRMRRAEAMLRNPDYKLSAIAAAVGYDTPFALSRAFKRSTGHSPRGPARKQL